VRWKEGEGKEGEGKRGRGEKSEGEIVRGGNSAFYNQSEKKEKNQSN
jgi:hypothetical protein